MRKITTIGLTCSGIALVAATAAAQVPVERLRTVTRAVSATHVAMYQRGAEEQTDRQTRTFKIGGQGDIDVSNLAGDITITRGGGNEVTVDVLKRARGRTAEEAREQLGLVTVQMVERGGRVEIRTEYPRHESGAWKGRGRNITTSVTYTITAPAGTRVSAKSLSGNLKATDIKGDLRLETLSGNVAITGAARISSAKSMSGDVSIADTQVEGLIDANSMSGNVTLRNVQARRLDIGSVSGNIVVQNVKCEGADLHSFSGNVEYLGTLAKNGRYEMKSHSGDVRLGLSGDTGFEIEATTFSGSLRSDVQLQGQNAEPASDRMRRRTLSGVHGDGSAMVEITTFSGNVLVARK